MQDALLASLAMLMMALAIIIFVAFGAMRKADLEDAELPPSAPLFAIVAGAVLISAQAGIWVMLGLKLGGAL